MRTDMGERKREGEKEERRGGGEGRNDWGERAREVGKKGGRRGRERSGEVRRRRRREKLSLEERREAKRKGI